MAVLRVHASKEEAWRLIHESANRCADEVCSLVPYQLRLTSGDVQVTLTADAQRSAAVERDITDVVIEPSYKPRKRLALAAGFLWSWWTLFVAYRELTMNQNIPYALKNMVFYSIPILIVLASMIYSSQRRLRKLLSKLKRDLEQGIKVEQLTPLTHDSVSKFYDALVIFSFLALLYLICLSNFRAVFSVLILPYLIAVVLGSISESLLSTSWQSHLAKIENAAQLSCFLVIVWFCVSLYFGAMQYSILVDNFPQAGVFSYEPGVISELVVMMTRDYEASNEPSRQFVQETFSNVKGEDIYAKTFVMTQGFYLVICGFFLGNHLRIRKSWEAIYVFSSSSLLPASLPELWKVSTSGKILLVVSGLFRGIVYWICVVIAVDALAFLISGNTLFSDIVGLSLALVEVNIQKVGLFSNSPLISKCLIFLLVLPGALLLVPTTLRLASLLRCFSRPPNPEQDEWFQSAVEYVQTMCRQYNVEAPPVKLLLSKQPKLFVEPGLFGRGRTLVISDSCSDVLEGEELNALILHEIQHLVNDVWRIETLNLLSLFFLNPVNYFFVLYDFPGSEISADKFAVSVLGDTKPLVSALVKLSVFQHMLPDERHPRGLVRRTLSQMRNRSISLNESLFGASYPFLNYRLSVLSAHG